ncbi:MAG: UBP-type zinc finger domain-containing protein [Mycobacterium sp.]
MLKRSRRREAVPQTCEHLQAAVGIVEPPPLHPGRCQECADDGADAWAHLRMCLSCGYVGCCDSSPHQHATAHFHRTGHPVMRSVEPGESWRWCYVDSRIG